MSTAGLAVVSIVRILEAPTILMRPCVKYVQPIYSASPVNIN